MHIHTPHTRTLVCHTRDFSPKESRQSRRPIAPTQVQVFSARGGSKMGLFREPVMRHLCVTTARRAQRQFGHISSPPAQTSRQTSCQSPLASSAGDTVPEPVRHARRRTW